MIQSKCKHAKLHVVIRVYVTKTGVFHEHTYIYYRCQRTCCRKNRTDKKAIKAKYIGY